MSEFLTTREVAALLRVKQRKIYELVGERAIPFSRVTGKLLFPRDLVESWVRRRVEFAGDAEALAPPPPVVAGSHDPLLEWALRESGSELATLFGGSLDGLARMAARRAVAAGMHVPEPETGEWNRVHVAERLPGAAVVLVEWAWRTQGLVVPAGNPRRIAGAADLRGLRVVPRQADAGSRLLLAQVLAAAGVGEGEVDLVAPPARTESDVAAHVAEGKADAGLAIESVARAHGLGFVALARERFDLLIWRREYFEPPLQRLMGFARGEPFLRRAGEIGGYDVSGLGTVRLNGP